MLCKLRSLLVPSKLDESQPKNSPCQSRRASNSLLDSLVARWREEAQEELGWLNRPWLPEQSMFLVIPGGVCRGRKRRQSDLRSICVNLLRPSSRTSRTSAATRQDAKTASRAKIGWSRLVVPLTIYSYRSLRSTEYSYLRTFKAVTLTYQV